MLEGTRLSSEISLTRTDMSSLLSWTIASQRSHPGLIPTEVQQFFSLPGVPTLRVKQYWKMPSSAPGNCKQNNFPENVLTSCRKFLSSFICYLECHII